MCLKTKELIPKVADKDIVAYKCFRSIKEKYSSKPYRYMQTLFVDHPVSYDEMTGKAPFIAKGNDKVHFDKETQEYSIGAGYIHVFPDRNTAKKLLQEHFIGKDWYFPVVVEVTIPKGTEYYEGIEGHYLLCIAAKQVIIGKCLDCWVDHKFYDYDEYVASLEKIKSAREKQPFD